MWHAVAMNTLRHPGSWLGVMAWAALFGLALIASPWVPHTPIATMISFGVIFCALAGVVIAGSYGAALVETNWRGVGVATLLGLAAVAGGAWLDDAPSALLIGAGLILAASTIGARIGHEVQEASYLWPLVIVALGADIWSVTTPEGVTQQLIGDGIPPGVPLIILTLPVPGLGLSPVLGIGDLLFSGLMLGAVARLGLSMRRAVIGLGVGFACCLAGLFFWAVPLPALPFIGLAGVIALGRQAPIKPREAGLAVLFVGGVFLIRWAVL